MVKLFYLILVGVVILVVGISAVEAIEANSSTSISSVMQNNVVVQPVNGIYKLPSSNLEPVLISFSNQISILSLKNVSYSEYYTNLTPSHVIFKNQIQFLLLAFPPYDFDLHFTMVYQTIGLFGVVYTHTQTFTIIFE